MNERITKLYSCCLDNKVIVIDTNFKGFYDNLKNITECKNERWYSTRFNELGSFSQEINGKEYYFQRLV